METQFVILRGFRDQIIRIRNSDSQEYLITRFPVGKLCVPKTYLEFSDFRQKKWEKTPIREFGGNCSQYMCFRFV